MDELKGLLREVGCVVSTRAGKALVRIPRSEECARCLACALLDPERGMMAEVDNPIGASAGDTVRIETAGAEGKVKAALLLYGFPLLAMLAGAIGSQPLFRRLGAAAAAEGLSVLAGLVLLAASFALLYLIRKRSGKQSLRSRIVEILERSEAGQFSQ
jgi:positive regulator of sigma E activity